MINPVHFKFGIRSRSKSWIWLAAACSLFSFAASAQTYPVSGVWVARNALFPASKTGECLTLKTFGVDAVSKGSLPTVMIFSNGKRIEVRADYHAERAIRSVKSTWDGSFRITESLGKPGKWLPWTNQQSYDLKIVDPMIIEITE